MDTNDLIDDKNLNLWEFLLKNCNIGVVREKRTEYFVESRQNESTIFVPYDNLNPAFFTHELLHIYLRVKNIFVGGHLKGLVLGDNELFKIFNYKLLEHIGNCLDHIKMFPEFVKLGYGENEFIMDYHIKKINEGELIDIKKYYFINFAFFWKIYNGKAINYYIGKYFSIKACPNKNFNYNLELNELKNIDKQLFQILESFLEDWRDFNITIDDYHSFTHEFVLKIKAWIKPKYIK